MAGLYIQFSQFSQSNNKINQEVHDGPISLTRIQLSL